MGVGNVHIRIGELVLDGLPQSDGRRVAEAVKQELARLVRERGVEQPSRPRTSVRQMSAPSFAMAPGAAPQTIGKSVARSLHSALTARTLTGRRSSAKGKSK